MTTDCNGLYCYLNPRLGAIHAVAEAARNIACSGGVGIAVTNCLNFGNPYNPEIYYGFSEAVAGMGEACRALETPVTGGNVSFYNEDPQRAVFPTPVIGMIGLIDDIDHITTSHFKDTGDEVVLLGRNTNEVGASEYLATIHKRQEGKVPALDLEAERRLHRALHEMIASGVVKSAHDCSEGGLAVALAESCIGNREQMIGAKVQIDMGGLRTDAALFGEAASRVVVSVLPGKSAQAMAIAAEHGVPAATIGRVGGDRLIISDLIDVTLASIAPAYYDTLRAVMERPGR
jgi:phosphoribosylformylglycinamidine synthase